MASVDRVGRQYPLTTAISHNVPNMVASQFANGAVFDQIENIALGAQALSQSHGIKTALWPTQMQDDDRLLATPGLPEGRSLRALFDLSPFLWSASRVQAQA